MARPAKPCPSWANGLPDALQALDLSTCHPPARVEFEREIEQLAEGSGFRNLEWYIPYLYSQPASILDYLPGNGYLFLDDAAEIMATLADLTGQAEQVARDLAAAGDIPRDLDGPILRGRRLEREVQRASGAAPWPNHT